MTIDRDPTRHNARPIPAAQGGNERLLTIAEAAAIVRAPIATLRYWRHLGTGPRSFRLGRRVLYRHDELLAWIAHQHDHDGGPHAA